MAWGAGQAGSDLLHRRKKPTPTNKMSKLNSELLSSSIADILAFSKGEKITVKGGEVKQGKVRAIGCSNETCWGVMKGLRAAEQHGLTRYDTVQNSFSLLNRANWANQSSKIAVGYLEPP